MSPARAAAGAALAGVWIVAAALLWRSTLPDGLDLPAVDVARRFPADALREAERYERFYRWEWLASQAVLLLVLAAYARRGAVFVRESAAGPIGTGMLLGMIGFALVWLAQLPFRIAEVWWERRHGADEIGYLEALFANWFALGAEFLFVSTGLLVVMALARRLPRLWWAPATPVFVALIALFTFVYPYLVESEPLRDPELREAVREYGREQGVADVPVRVEPVSEWTSQPNAYAIGFGPSRRVFLWDTLVDGDFSDEEVSTVIAHEYGHHSRGHLPENLGWAALFFLPGAWVVARATRRRGGMGEPRAVPLALLVGVAFTTLTAPLENVVSRHLELEADWAALESTEDPAAARALFTSFTEEALADPDPPLWAHLLVDTHPTMAERIALADAWERMRGSR